MSDKLRCKGCGVVVRELELASGTMVLCEPRRSSIVSDDGRVIQGHAPHWLRCPASRSPRKPMRAVSPGEEPPEEEARDFFAQIRANIGAKEE